MILTPIGRSDASLVFCFCLVQLMLSASFFFYPLIYLLYVGLVIIIHLGLNVKATKGISNATKQIERNKKRLYKGNVTMAPQPIVPNFMSPISR